MKRDKDDSNVFFWLSSLVVITIVLFSAMVMAQEPIPPTQDLYATGSGEFITSNCDLVTANHVIEGAKTIKVFVKGAWYAVDVLAADPVADVAILHVHTTGCNAVSFNTKFERGDVVYALGFPRPSDLNFNNVLTKGIIANSELINDSQSYILTNLEIAPGNSGGGLFNKLGELIGITNQAMATPFEFGSTYSLSVPVRVILNVIKDNNLKLDITISSGFLSIEKLPNIDSVVLVGNFQDPQITKDIVVK